MIQCFNKPIFRKQFSQGIRLLIYDPYSTMTVARSDSIADALLVAAAYLKRGQSMGNFIDSYPDFPEAADFRFSTASRVFRGM